MNLEQLITAAAEKAAAKAARRTVEELRRAGLLRVTQGGTNYYKRAENLLRRYKEGDITAEQAAAVEQALAGISGERYADVVQLYYFEGKKDADIAEEIHASQRTVARGRQRLVQKLSAKIGKL